MDGLVAVSNLEAPGFVIFVDSAESKNYVQFTEAICEASSHNQPGMKQLSPAQRQALLGLGFQAPVSPGDNFWMDYSTRSLDEMVTTIESAFVILGASPNFAIVVEFDDGKSSIPVDMERNQPASNIAADGEIGSYKVSEVKTDAVRAAWCSGSLARMLTVLDMPTAPVDRHYLLQSIVRIAYAERNRDPEMRSLCEKIAWIHLTEFSTLSEALLLDCRKGVDEFYPVGVPTFKHLAIVLTENGEFDKAVEVCELAMKYRLHAEASGGWEQRIERIRKKQHEKT